MSHWSHLKSGYTLDNLKEVSLRLSKNDPWIIPFDTEKPLISKAKGEMPRDRCQNYGQGDIMKVRTNYDVNFPGRIRKLMSETRGKNAGYYRRPSDSYDIPPLYRVYLFCLFANLVECENQQCRQLRDQMGQYFPKKVSAWPQFRDWVLVRTSCLITSGMIKGVNEHDGVTAFFGGITKVGAPPTDLSTEIYEMVDWMSKVELYENLGRTKKESRVGYYWEQASPSHYRHVTSPPSQEVYEPKIIEALNQAHTLGICENRLLNIISASERADFDLPALVTDITLTRQPRNFTHRESADRLNDAAKTMHIPGTQNIGHTECTPTICHFATIDSTRVSILHKCASRGCRKWSPSEEDFNRPGPYTWCISNDVPRPGQGHYAAISHVWSDGTGSANDSVNRCLFDYFCSIAKAEKCNAIWWDAISIPRETKARALSIRRMHRNFSEAKTTIVHDLYTATYPWANDGSPCIALALSPWFTRGWTALELLVSKNVKVIFQHPNDPKRYVIKDLETEVLASHPAYCSRGHWIASTAIRRLRQMKIQSVTDLLHLLATRSTTWESDRLVIAALVRGLDTNVQGPDIKAALTREIITSFPKIDPSFLHHGYSLPRKQGIFSWCPSTLLHGGKPFVSPGYNSTEWLNVSKDGTLIGSFTMKILEENDKDSLSAFAQEPAARSRIDMALRKWRQCMLIWPRLSNGMLRDPAILVTVIEIGVKPPSPTKLLDCRMEGTVYGGLPSSGYHVSVRLGKTSGSPSKSARELYDLWIKEYLNV